MTSPKVWSLVAAILASGALVLSIAAYRGSTAPEYVAPPPTLVRRAQPLPGPPVIRTEPQDSSAQDRIRSLEEQQGIRRAYP